MLIQNLRALGYRRCGPLGRSWAPTRGAPRQIGGRLGFSNVAPKSELAESEEPLAPTAQQPRTQSHRERELILSVLSTVPSPREARKFLNSVSGNETMRSQREFEERQARLATEAPAARVPSQLVPGEILRSVAASADSAATAASEAVPRRLTATVFIDGLDSDRACMRAGKLLAHIQRIGVAPVVLLSSHGVRDGPDHGSYRQIIKRVHQLSDAVEREGGKARPINEGVFYNSPYSHAELTVDPELIGAAIAQGQAPIISPLMADAALRVQTLETKQAAPALARALALSSSTQHAMAGSRGEFSLLLARLILLGNADGLTSADGGSFHRFINLEEDYSEIAAAGCKQADSLELMRTCLDILPPTAAGIVASVNSDPPLVLKGLISERPVSTQHKSAAQRVQRDRGSAHQKPEHSRLAVPSYQPLASYPFVRIGNDHAGGALGAQPAAETPTQFTLLRHGFRIARYTSVDACNLPRLRGLLESSFKKTLDGGRYFDRLRALERSGGIEIIVAGDYQGAVVATHEPIPGSDQTLPYLDKFAVHPSAQGTGMADILWTQLRRACPSCMWRSRNDNGVNNWYFDRSNGHFRSRALQPGESGTRWVFFWYQSQIPGQRTLTADQIHKGIAMSQSIPASFCAKQD
ncbi:Amino-acid acetyltransferase, mitochondrial [Coemansia sp. RSA 552]|nr:Amino-acid acetyltransferase, mitochondrial [Coemansia sp. RSA 552]